MCPTPASPTGRELLLGEIDLSVGAVSGLCASVMAVLSVRHGWSPYLAIAGAIAVGAAIGTFQGSVFTQFGIPSFVVTLAGLLGWQGAQLEVLGASELTLFSRGSGGEGSGDGIRRLAAGERGGA